MLMRGTMTALVTPMKNDAIDESAFKALVESQIAGGVTGLIPVGTTGEAVTLTPEERERVIALTVEYARGRASVMAGVGTNDTRSTIEASVRAKALGADGLLVVTPYYNKPTQEGLYRHFRAVADAVDLDICLYNVPGRTGVHMEPATVERLMVAPNIKGIKEATGNMMVASELTLRCGDRLGMLSGDDFTTLPFLAQGGHGVISVATNVVPDLMSQLVNAALENRMAEAQKLHFKLYPLFQALFAESNPIPVKSALAMMGRMTGERRLPLCELGEANEVRLREVLVRLELLSRAA